MSTSEATRRLAAVRHHHGKASEQYARAVLDFLAGCVDPATGVIGLQDTGFCPACAIESQLLDLPLRFRSGWCPACDDTGLACPGCRNANWVRQGPPGYDPNDLGDNSIATLRPCPVCARGIGDEKYQRDGLAAVQALAARYHPLAF